MLGQSYVAAGLKQTFVQLAFPASWTDKSFGTVSVITYWRQYDQKKGTLGRVIKGSLHTQYLNAEIPNFAQSYLLMPRGFSDRDLEDLGNGKMLVKLHQRFLPDTTLRIGATILTSGEGGIVANTPQGIEFVASLSDLATKQVFLVSRDGSELPLAIPHLADTSTRMPPPVITKVDVSTVDETNSLVSIQFKDAASVTDDKPKLVLVVGSKVFGYSDAPFTRRRRRAPFARSCRPLC